MKDEVKERIKEEILNEFSTLKEFADEIGYSYSQITNYFNTDVNPGINFFQVLAGRGYDLYFIFLGIRHDGWNKDIAQIYSGFSKDIPKTFEQIREHLNLKWHP